MTGAPHTSDERHEPGEPDPATDAARRVLAGLSARGATLAVAESLTGGLIGATLTAVPGASAAFRGGIVCYATDLKTRLVGVDPALLDRHGAVHPEVAAAMARGVRRVLVATFGLAVTGVAGPDGQDGQPPGTVYAAVCGPGEDTTVTPLWLPGDRRAVRERTTLRALDLLDAAMTENTPTGPGPAE